MRSPKSLLSLGQVAVVVLMAMLPACSPDTSLTPEVAPARISAARASTAANSDPNAYYTFDDSVNVAAPGSDPAWSAAGIRGDERLKNGAPSAGSPSNEYQGDYCGVYAVSGYQKQGKGTFNTDPDINWTTTIQSSCGSARRFSFYLNGLSAAPTMVGPHSVVDSLGVLAVGQVSSRLVMFGVQLANCDGIRFGNGYPPANDAKVTRLNDVVTSAGAIAKQWRVESQGSHLGACVIRKKSGALVATGVTYYLPFAITITEVPQPATNFP